MEAANHVFPEVLCIEGWSVGKLDLGKIEEKSYRPLAQ
jgi:hypothetical protein